MRAFCGLSTTEELVPAGFPAFRQPDSRRIRPRQTGDSIQADLPACRLARCRKMLPVPAVWVGHVYPGADLMRRSVLSLCAALALTTLTVLAADTGTKYGDGITVEKATAIGDLLKSPEQFKGKTVRIDGTIAAVCEEMGCWIQIEDPATKAAIRCKVEDGVIVFPVAAKGKKASAQGTLERIGDDPETAKHMEEQKKDPTKPVEPHGRQRAPCTSSARRERSSTRRAASAGRPASVHGVGRLQGERRDPRIELFTRGRDHLVGALHRAEGHPQRAARGVSKLSPGSRIGWRPTTPGPRTSSTCPPPSVMIQCRVTSWTVSVPSLAMSTV